MWARIVNNVVMEVWAMKPVLHPDLMKDVSEKTLAELAALGWTPPPPPPPPPTPKEALEQDVDSNRMLKALFKREMTQRGLTKAQLLDELGTHMT
jgi:hypothetical protein